MKRRLLRAKKYIIENKLIIPIIGFLLVLSILMFYYNNVKIPKEVSKKEMEVRQEIDIDAMPKTLSAIVKDENISKYTLLTDDVIEEYIEFVEIPDRYVIENIVTNKGDLIDAVAIEDLRVGEQINKESIISEKDHFGNYDRLKEYVVKTIVAEEVKEGSIVDVVINYGNGEYDVILPKTKVKKLIKGSSNSDDEESQQRNHESDLFRNREYMATFIVDEDDYRDMILAERLAELINEERNQDNLDKGYFELRLYLDEDQLPSIKTFDFEEAYSKVLELSRENEDANIKESTSDYVEDNEDKKEQMNIQEQNESLPYFRKNEENSNIDNNVEIEIGD